MSSMETLKPALLFTTFFESLGKELSTVALDIHRIDIYKLVDENDEKYIEPFIPSDKSERFYLK